MLQYKYTEKMLPGHAGQKSKNSQSNDKNEPIEKRKHLICKRKGHFPLLVTLIVF